MQTVWLVALLPALLQSLWINGADAARVIGLAAFFAIAFDVLGSCILPNEHSCQDGHSLVLGIVFGFLLPVNAPWWMILTGCGIMILVGKRLFGGCGAYPVHPALLSYAMLWMSWPGRLDMTLASTGRDWGFATIEPLRFVQSYGPQAVEHFSWTNLLLGMQAAGTGSAMILGLLLGGLLLVMSRIVPWQIPLGFLLGLVVVSMLIPQSGGPLINLLAGSGLFAAFFLATDSSVSPVNRWPMFLYGLLGGILLVLVRSWSSHIDGAVFTVLIMNICSPLLDRITPKVSGLQEVKHA